jgi:hypothetical protein
MPAPPSGCIRHPSAAVQEDCESDSSHDRDEEYSRSGPRHGVNGETHHQEDDDELGYLLLPTASTPHAVEPSRHGLGSARRACVHAIGDDQAASRADPTTWNGMNELDPLMTGAGARVWRNARQLQRFVGLRCSDGRRGRCFADIDLMMVRPRARARALGWLATATLRSVRTGALSRTSKGCKTTWRT